VCPYFLDPRFRYWIPMLFRRFFAFFALSGSLTTALAAPATPPAGLPTLAGLSPATRAVHLEWQPSVSEVMGYRVYRGTTSGGPYTNYTSGPVTSLSLDDSTAETGVTYYYVVTALGANGVESTYSNEVMVVVPVNIVHLEWEPSADYVVGYRVYRGQIEGGAYPNYTSGPVTALSFDDVTALSGATYYYVVTSLDAEGNESVYSNQASVVLP
jgi:fibronectin type 3 domain-containing protein